MRIPLTAAAKAAFNRRFANSTGKDGILFPRGWFRDRDLWLCFLLGLGAWVRVILVGELGVSDFIVFALTPVYFKRSLPFFKLKRNRNLIIWCGLLLAGLVIADIYRNSAPEDLMRGWARTAILLLSLMVLPALFEGKSYRFGGYFFGYLFGTFFQLFVGPAVDAYKFWIGLPLAGLCFLMVGLFRPKLGRQVLLLPLAIGGLSFVLNARSVAGMCMLATVVLFFNWKIKSSVRRSPKRMFVRSITIGVAIAISGMGIVSFYQYGASSGLFGAEAQSKYALQTQTEGGNANVLDTILGGRAEAQFQIPKLIESPIIGYGSWAKDPQYIKEIAAQIHYRIGKDRIAQGSIPGHSHILEGWLEAGFAAAVFWGTVFYRTFQCLLNAEYERGRLWGPLFCFSLTEFMWNILFSPFGGVARIHETVLILLVLNLLPRKFRLRKPAKAPASAPPAWPPLAIDTGGVPAQ